MTALFFFMIISQSRPVIRLDDSIIKGDVRRPSVIEVQGDKDLSESIERAALNNLIALEKRLLKAPSSETKENPKKD